MVVYGSVSCVRLSRALRDLDMPDGADTCLDSGHWPVWLIGNRETQDLGRCDLPRRLSLELCFTRCAASPPQ